MTDESLEREEMGARTLYEDRADIREVLSAYCFRMDDGDFAGVAAVFAEDGAWIAAYEQAQGRRAIAELLTRINPEPGVGPFRKHIVANSVVDVDGDTATSRASYLVLMDKGAGPAPIIVGTYADRWVRGTGGDAPWLLAERRLIHEIAGGDLALRLDTP